MLSTQFTDIKMRVIPVCRLFLRSFANLILRPFPCNDFHMIHANIVRSVAGHIKSFSRHVTTSPLVQVRVLVIPVDRNSLDCKGFVGTIAHIDRVDCDPVLAIAGGRHSHTKAVPAADPAVGIFQVLLLLVGSSLVNQCVVQIDIDLQCRIGIIPVKCPALYRNARILAADALHFSDRVAGRVIARAKTHIIYTASEIALRRFSTP